MSAASGACPSGETIDKWHNHVGSSAAPADELAQHVGIVNRRLDGDAEAAAMDLVVREGNDGVRAVNRLADADDVDVAATLRRVDALEPGTRSSAVRALNDGTISGEDFQRIARWVDEGATDQAAVERALTRATWLNDNGHDVTAFRLGEEANTRDPYYAVWYADDFTRNDLVDGRIPDSFQPGDPHPGYWPPHQSDGIVIEAQTGSTESFVRVHDPHNQQGPWMMPKDEFDTVAAQHGKSGLQEEFALPAERDLVSRVDVPEGESVRVSTVGPQDDLPGGGTQMEVRRYDSELESEWFSEHPVDIDEYIASEMP